VRPVVEVKDDTAALAEVFLIGAKHELVAGSHRGGWRGRRAGWRDGIVDAGECGLRRG
jgi:hypothetical protein